MKMFTFEGASDDLVEMSADPGGPDTRSRQEEASVPSGAWVGRLTSTTPGIGGALRLVLRVEGNGCWSAGLLQDDEGVPVPNWPVTYEHAHRISDQSIGYSVALHIEVPDDTLVEWIEDEQKRVFR